MSAIPAELWQWLIPALAVLAAALRLIVDRGGGASEFTLGPIVVVLPLAVAIALPHPGAAATLLIAGLVVAILARDHGDLLQSECALKLAWVLGGSLALSIAGSELLAMVTGTRLNAEQWAVLGAPIGPDDLWRVALPLSLLAGLVLLGGAPFHFWPADLFQGGRSWAAPLAAAALQVSGASWLARRLSGIESLPEARAVTSNLLAAVSGIAFLVGAATLLQQRRPERRIGTLASLHGALAIAMLLAGNGPGSEQWFARWSAHLAIGLTGAGLFARFLPVTSDVDPANRRGSVLFRRHPFSAIAGLLATLSLAGVPGTPGAAIWLEAARALAASRHSTLLALLGLAWLASFATVMRQWREAAGIPVRAPEGVPDPGVPGAARAALWVGAAGVILLGASWLVS
ncbi:MAG TPA: proton-conducting transporter membrane subunit [Candidatus Udaeobacter sp.]|jgi:NADH-quinone oxidoreductase subunit N|nr:proton-conducting transporter membrane subunit [Candidatus Udaeobacter sp.]